MQLERERWRVEQALRRENPGEDLEPRDQPERALTGYQRATLRSWL